MVSCCFHQHGKKLLYTGFAQAFCNDEAARLDPIAALFQTRGGQTGKGQKQYFSLPALRCTVDVRDGSAQFVL